MNDDGNLEDTADNAGVRVPPPLIILGFAIAGQLYDSSWIEGQFAGSAPTIAGALIAVLGLAIILVATWRHKAAGSNIEPWKPTTTILTTGLYSYSRNPIYLGMAISLAGLAIGTASLGTLVALLAAMLVIRFYVIEREERYLETKFGEDYLAYKRQVRRWI